MKVKSYWINKLLLDIEKNLPTEKANLYSLPYAGYLALGYEPVAKGNNRDPKLDAVDLVRRMRKEIIKEDKRFSRLSAWDTHVDAKFIKKWADQLGNTVIFQGNKPFTEKLLDKNPHISNEFQIALDVFAAVFGQTQINPKYRGLTYKQAIEDWLAENRPSIKVNSSEYNRIVMILNPDKHGNKIDERYFDN